MMGTGAQLRVFTQATSNICREVDEKNMAAMLDKFRIEYADVRIVSDLTRTPNNSTIRKFEQIIEPLRATNDPGDRTELITESDLSSQKFRTNRYLRTKELLLQHSRQADLIVL
ncbi:unnamed protein product [Anisakis simplex]|uniref:SLC12 domain-containing protein n=1 Tax=Anisakis simplex TaxID=6269 RepID=A0A0M3JID2_ANISI|nr:unnamed protein product [Anisakis simplex]